MVFKKINTPIYCFDTFGDMFFEVGGSKLIHALQGLWHFGSLRLTLWRLGNTEKAKTYQCQMTHDFT